MKNKNFDGLDISKLNRRDLIGVATVADKSFQKPNLDINVEDPEGVLPDDFGEIFQTAIKNILSATGQLKAVSVPGDVRDGGDIFLDLAVSRQEAQKGKYVPLEYQRRIICSQCEGEGSSHWRGTQSKTETLNDWNRLVHEKDMPDVQKCLKCEGNGTVTAQRRVEVKLPKDVKEGAVLRVANEGHAPSTGSGQVPGDLFVKVTFRED
ncbi:MAG: hypothetical protein A3I92_02145 [Candidatus Yanofskybacteria bacterium RIFCSPLOWO2_02_FULL_43_10b]|uniref:Chaperone DnaJ C-terminal domain-containing protein n=1 Tax=Candidatus Yanofskybacteria bacterium RIFCSPLOWO2_02_FULL_43_10b TaxID=1802704 RepID=A0A1F8H6W4_9BACT|nr:MAG: hypothetical protein A3I92_02145 [Candidatus Yanofskybacteria bacterium RIFCSPLOWO2_02_FULL_43_10b]